MRNFLDAVAAYSNATDRIDRQRAEEAAERAFAGLLPPDGVTDEQFGKLVRTNVQTIVNALNAHKRSLS